MVKDHWYIACESLALRRRQGAVMLFDGPVVLLRDAAGNPNPLEDRCLRPYPSLEQDGHVWVCLGGSTARDAPIPFAHGAAGWTSFRMRFEAPVGACLENFFDCPHATFLHRFWFRAATAKPRSQLC